MTSHKLPFKFHRGRSIESLEAKDEAKKHKTQKKKVRSNKQRYDLAVIFLIGNEVFYMHFRDQGIHGDENKFCL